jgi:hypothetical protein
MKQLLTIGFVFLSVCIYAQFDSSYIHKADTFFLVKKPGIIGKLAQNISRSNLEAPAPAIKNDEVFAAFKGKQVRNIQIIQLGLGGNVNAPQEVELNALNKLADRVHATTRAAVVRKNLFFTEGDTIRPDLMADNERHLREQPFVQDALLKLSIVPGMPEYVDVLVIVKDVFSLGVSANIGSPEDGELVITEENLFGSGDQLSIRTLYEAKRADTWGFGGSYTKRNIAGSFTDFSIGFQTYRPAFNTGKRNEDYRFIRLSKSLVNPYMTFTYALEVGKQQTNNMYLSDSAYFADARYDANVVDAWAGYNLGTKNYFKKNSGSRFRHFLAARGFYRHFVQVPDKFQNIYNYQYADLRGGLVTVSAFRQDFFKARYVYGFGRNEDVPEGVNVAITGGYTDKEQRLRAYLGLDFQRFYFKTRGDYFNFAFRASTYLHKANPEDVAVLASLDYFSKLYQRGGRWMQRNFLHFSAAGQYRTLLNEPLYINNVFGLAEFRRGDIQAAARLTTRAESVFYNSWSFYGFRFAPFVFGGFSLLKPIGTGWGKSDGFTSIGGGVKSRNENLVFGTMELRMFYFPRVIGGMNRFRIDFNTDLRFRFISQFIKRPDFMSVNQ